MDNSNTQEPHHLYADQGNVVMRNEADTQQYATVSFGPVWPASKYQNVLDVVNYYRPNPKSHLYLPENSFFNSNGKVRPHAGGELTSRDSASNPKQGATHTNNDDLEQQFNDVESIDSDKDTVVPEARAKGLFEVPFDVYSMPRLIAPFKGFSKIVTPRAVRLLMFAENEEGRLLCRVDKNGLKLLQKQVGDLSVVAVSFVGDPKSGKSFLASHLVGKDNTSFNISQPYIDPNNMLTHGAAWAYLAVYQENHAYLFLDFEGFEHSESSREKMLLFAFALSSLVLCNVKYALMTGVHNSVNAMIQLTKKPAVNEVLGEDEMLDEDETAFLELLKGKGTRLLSTSYDTQNFSEMTRGPEDLESVEERRDLWKAPIVQFVFRDCSGFVKCVDDRIFTPETLVEQGLFENYLDPFGTEQRTPNFKNEMLDAFEVFTNRKYLSLPHPTLSTHPYSETDNPEDEGLNLTSFFMKLLATDKDDLKKLARFGYDNFTLSTNLSSIFYEKLDQLKSLVYHDTLNYAMAHTQLNGRMFGEYLKKLALHFNSKNAFMVDDLNDMLANVFLAENSNVLKAALLQFLRQVRSNVAPKLPVDSKTLLNLVISAKFTSLNYFEAKAFGTPEEYKAQLEELSSTLEELMHKLENKNKSLMTAQIAGYVERKEGNIRSNILKSNYGVKDLNDDLSKLKKQLSLKFTESELVTKVLARASQNLVRLFNDTHPDTFVHNLSYSKSSSIEETFESLNTDITSMTSNLNLLPLPRKTPAHSGAVETVRDPPAAPLSVQLAGVKLENEREDNALENPETDSSEESEEDQDEESESESTPKAQDEAQNEVVEETGEDAEESESDDSEFEEGAPDVEPEEESGEASEYDSDEETDEQDAPEEESESEDWPVAESGATKSPSRSFELADNGDTSYHDEPVPEKADELAEVFEDDFVQEEIDSASDSSEESVERESTPRDKRTVLKKIFEKSAGAFLEKRGARNVAL